jgi:hypothetical protein
MLSAAALGGVYSVVALFVSVGAWLSLALDIGVCLGMCVLCSAGKGVRVGRVLLLFGTYFGVSALSTTSAMSHEGQKETMENIVVLPVENAEHCAKIMCDYFDWDEDEINRIPYIITGTMTKKLSEYFSKVKVGG